MDRVVRLTSESLELEIALRMARAENDMLRAELEKVGRQDAEGER